MLLRKNSSVIFLFEWNISTSLFLEIWNLLSMNFLMRRSLLFVPPLEDGQRISNFRCCWAVASPRFCAIKRNFHASSARLTRHLPSFSKTIKPQLQRREWPFTIFSLTIICVWFSILSKINSFVRTFCWLVSFESLSNRDLCQIFVQHHYRTKQLLCHALWGTPYAFQGPSTPTLRPTL